MPGDSVVANSGALSALVKISDGQITLTGPNRAGLAQGNSITIAPPSAQQAGRQLTIGRIISSSSATAGQVDLVQQFGDGQVQSRLSFPTPFVMRYEVLGWGGPVPEAVSLAGLADPNEHFYGFGEKFNSLDQTGNVVEILTFDNPGNKGDRSYKVAPWFVSTRGYGFHFDSTAHSTFNMRTAASGRYTVTNQFGSLRFHIVYGPQLTDVISRYTELTGRPTLPPPWAFGPWISTDVWRDGGEVRYAVKKFRERGIPVSAIVFDSPWEVAYNDFTFNIGNPADTQFGHDGIFEGIHFDGFTSVSQLMSHLQQNGLKAICWMTPFANVESNDEGIRGQNLGRAQLAGSRPEFFVADRAGQPLVVPWWKGRGSPIDFTNADARIWLKDRLTDLVDASLVATRSGTEPAIGGFKTDDGESASSDSHTYIPINAVYHDGRTGQEMVNGYCVEYHRTVAEVLRDQGLLFARSGFTGTQAFPGCWAGDNEPNFGVQNGLPSVIVAGLSSAMSGFSIWGHDVGGYQNSNFSPASPADLFMRWTQFGCFSPLMQMHRQVDSANLRQYPWGYAQQGETIDDNAALNNYRFYATLHTRLFPYLYTYAKQASETGVPIIRPLVLLHPDDPNTFAVNHSYYFGNELLVAPIIEPQATTRQIYLPAGDWCDFWTNSPRTGGQEITWDSPNRPVSPKSKIPVFVKRGGIIPFMLGTDVQTLCDADYVNNATIHTWNGNLELRIFPGGDTQFVMYDNTVIRCHAAQNGVTVTLTSSISRSILLMILGAKPSRVTMDGQPLPALDGVEFATADSAWQSDATNGAVLIKFAQPVGLRKIQTVSALN